MHTYDTSRDVCESNTLGIGDHARQTDAVGSHNVAEHSKHGNTAVFDLYVCVCVHLCVCLCVRTSSGKAG